MMSRINEVKSADKTQVAQNFAETNSQVENVDEPEIVKTD